MKNKYILYIYFSLHSVIQLSEQFWNSENAIAFGGGLTVKSVQSQRILGPHMSGILKSYLGYNAQRMGGGSMGVQ